MWHNCTHYFASLQKKSQQSKEPTNKVCKVPPKIKCQHHLTPMDYITPKKERFEFECVPKTVLNLYTGLVLTNKIRMFYFTQTYYGQIVYAKNTEKNTSLTSKRQRWKMKQQHAIFRNQQVGWSNLMRQLLTERWGCWSFFICLRRKISRSVGIRNFLSTITLGTRVNRILITVPKPPRFLHNNNIKRIRY